MKKLENNNTSFGSVEGRVISINHMDLSFALYDDTTHTIVKCTLIVDKFDSYLDRGLFTFQFKSYLEKLCYSKVNLNVFGEITYKSNKRIDITIKNFSSIKPIPDGCDYKKVLGIFE